MVTHQRNTTIELHRLYETAGHNADQLYTQLETLANSDQTLTCGEERFEILDLSVWPNSVRGVVRKFQDDDFPRYGHRGGNESPLDIPDGAGLINRVHFMFYKRDGLLAIQRNGLICTAGRFSRLLTELLDLTVTFSPVIRHDQLALLQAKAGQIKKMEVRFSGNPNAQEYEADDFSDQAMQWMNGMNGYAGTFTMRGNTHSTDPSRRFLDQRLAALVPNWARRGQVTKAKIWVDDITHPIDLFADKVVHVAHVDYANRYPVERSIREAIQDAAQGYFNGELG